MKKQSFLLLAGSVIMFAACNNASTEKPAENVDSIANAKAETMRSEMAAKNDSIINAMAKAKADSTEAAMKAEEAKKEEESKGKAAHHDKAHHDTKKDDTKAAVTPPPPPPASTTPANTGKADGSQGQNTGKRK